MKKIDEAMMQRIMEGTRGKADTDKRIACQWFKEVIESKDSVPTEVVNAFHRLMPSVFPEEKRRKMLYTLAVLGLRNDGDNVTLDEFYKATHGGRGDARTLVARAKQGGVVLSFKDDVLTLEKAGRDWEAIESKGVAIVNNILEDYDE